MQPLPLYPPPLYVPPLSSLPPLRPLRPRARLHPARASRHRRRGSSGAYPAVPRSCPQHQPQPARGEHFSRPDKVATQERAVHHSDFTNTSNMFTYDYTYAHENTYDYVLYQSDNHHWICTPSAKCDAQVGKETKWPAVLALCTAQHGDGWEKDSGRLTPDR